MGDFLEPTWRISDIHYGKLYYVLTNLSWIIYMPLMLFLFLSELKYLRRNVFNSVIMPDHNNTLNTSKHCSAPDK